MEFKRGLEKFVCLGVELNAPVNLMPPGKFPALKNARSYQAGRLEAREGMTRLNPAPLTTANIHSVARMNDYISIDFIRFVGAGGKVFAGQTVFTEVDSGFDEKPLSIIPFRPDQSIRDWAYISNAGKSIKVNAEKTKYKVGVKPPTAILSADLNGATYGVAVAPAVELGWVADGIAGQPVFEQLLSSVSVDTDNPDGKGWTSVVPANAGNFWDIAEHDLLWVGGNSVVAEELHYLPDPDTTAVNIIADAVGSLATVQPNKNIKGLRRNSLVQVGGGLGRVISVKADKNQINSFKIAASGGPGTGITAPTHSFRVVADQTYAGSIEKHAIGATFTGPGKGTITSKKGSPGFNLTSASNNQTIGLSDYITFSVYVSDLTRFTGIRVLLDIDKNTTSATATDQIGVRNALYKDLTPNDFNGSYAWKTFRTRVAEWTRVGGDSGCGLDDIRAVQLMVVTPGDSDPGDTVQAKLGFIYSSGGSGPDTATNLQPYLYRYRYRSSSTGAKSNPGPAMYSGIVAQRQQIHLSNLVASTDPQVDKIDIERFGGNNQEWHYIGTVDNDSGSVFEDGATDAELIATSALEVDRFETFPVPQFPYSAQVSVAGTAVKLESGEPFDTDWARGTEVIVNGFRTTLASSPSSNTIQLNDSAGGAGSGAFLEIPEPIKAGVPLPVMWGPFYEVMFGVGDQKNPGRLHFTNSSDPDSASDTGFIDITSPTEKLMGGIIYDGRNYVFSDKRIFSILPINNPNEPLQKFQFTEVKTARGLWAPWAITVGPRIWYLGSDGIYETEGGEPVLISKDIQPVFPRGENPGFEVRGIKPVDMSIAGGTAEGNLRLTYHNQFLYFDYIDASGTNRTMVYDTIEKAWFPDEFFEGTGRGINCRFSEYGSVEGDEVGTLLCGGNDGLVYFPGGTSDDGLDIKGFIDTPAKDFGDSRAKKVYSELVYELNTQSVTVKMTPFLNNYEDALDFKEYVTTEQIIADPQDLSDGIGVFARNLGVRIEWVSKIGSPQFYSWEPAYLERPEDTFLRADDWNDGGYNGSKFITGFLVEADTEGVNKLVELDADQQTVQTYTMNHAGQTVKVYTVKPQFIGTLLRLRPKQSVAWREFKVSYIYEKYPELSDLVTPYTDGGKQGAKLFRGFDLEALGAAELLIEKDGGVAGPTVSASHTGITALHNKPYAFRPPFIAQEVRINPQSAIRLGKVQWIFDLYPDLSPLITPYTDGGYPGAKFVQGLKLEAAGVADLFADYDGDTQGPGFNANHTDTDGVGVLITKPYSFQTPFIAHELRLRTSDPTTNIRLGKIDWVFEPAPELTDHWVSQGTSHGIPGWQFLKDGYIAHISTKDLTLTVIVDGRIYFYTIPNSGGVYRKSYLLFGSNVTGTATGIPLKGKLFQYRLDSSAGFRLFKRDCEVRLHAWMGGSYLIRHPFGDVDSEDGARI